ncbi:DNA cytosine methyltransferase [Dyadobacter sp. CY326]|uniref:DNA cytosine methyltransferase n=1 Tax=Dyadobacter sp. CY326 TaxID=2907300 RepID=UPI001F2D70B8|nr:DNA cytosine methyltransferase [Dyadobacter sp. CY326]MCE7066680.1 DNA cytosine methyltransferase [Dyadobacter sp. CY326]
MPEIIQPYNLPLLSFFSGGGFLDMGFEMAGFETVFSNELDQDFAKFYSEGMSSWSGKNRKITIVGDIAGIPKESLPINMKRPFGIIGGPPCQDFSIRGHKTGFDGLRGTLTYHFYEKIMDLQPTFFLMENVPGLVMLKKTKEAFKEILELFEEDYFISMSKLNSLHFGSPQFRERLFIFGIRRSLMSKRQGSNVSFTWPKPLFPRAEKMYNWGEPEFKKTDLAMLMEDPPKKLCVSSILIEGIKMNEIPNGQEYFNFKSFEKVGSILEGDTYRPSFKRLHRNKYSPTACYGNNEVHVHPVEHRRISVRESLRIQGLPDSYILETKGNLTKKFKMIGNGVPVPLARAVADSIIIFLKEIEVIKMDCHLVPDDSSVSNS